jgi:hypothetical protein
VQIKYLKEWKKSFDDLELLLISKQCSEIYLKNIKSEVVNVIINIADISKNSEIPRATCLRKLRKLEKLGGIAQNNKTKRYFMSSNHLDSSQIAKKDKTFNIIKLYSNFFYTCVKALALKT